MVAEAQWQAKQLGPTWETRYKANLATSFILGRLFCKHMNDVRGKFLQDKVKDGGREGRDLQINLRRRHATSLVPWAH